MVTRVAEYSVLVPVHNEASVLPRTVPELLASIGSDRAEIVFVCNGCRDGSAALIRHLAGDRARVLELPKAGKTQAMNAGDAHLTAFPRFYLDADVLMPTGALGQLSDALREEGMDLVSPRVAYDTSTANTVARYVSEIGQALPHGQIGGFHGLLGLSSAGRARWDRFPEILGDDIFIEAMIPVEKRLVLQSVTVVTWPPAGFWSWVHVRARWIRGERELSRLGTGVVRTPGQARVLARMMMTRESCAAAIAYCIVRTLASILSLTPLSSLTRKTWYRDRR